MKMKMAKTMEYKGYIGSVDYSEDDNMYFGKVLGIKGLFMYEGQSVKELRDDFQDLIDEYLEECKSKGAEPMKPYKDER